VPQTAGSWHHPVVTAFDWIGAGHESPQSAIYVGLTETAALAAARSSHAGDVRVLDGHLPVEADLKPTRLTLFVEGGCVSKAAFFLS
jgi:hypothetical protein